MRKFLSGLFLNHLWSGIVLIILGLYFETRYNISSGFLKVLTEFLKSVGIAILIAFIFTYVSGTDAFMKKIKTLLREVVLDRNFLTNLDTKEKEKIVLMLIKPSSTERQLYSNIEDYYQYYITKTLEISQKNVRSDYCVMTKFFIDPEKDVVAADQLISYRLYPNSHGYNELTIGYREDGLSKCCSISISTPSGMREYYTSEQIKVEPKQIGGIKAQIAKFDLKKYGERNEPYLKIELRIIEYGHDHWMPLQFQALQATDGFRYIVNAECNLKITFKETYSQGVSFHVQENEAKTELTISCDQWINEGSGIMVIASRDSSIPCKIAPSQQENEQDFLKRCQTTLSLSEVAASSEDI